VIATISVELGGVGQVIFVYRWLPMSHSLCVSRKPVDYSL